MHDLVRMTFKIEIYPVKDAGFLQTGKLMVWLSDDCIMSELRIARILVYHKPVHMVGLIALCHQCLNIKALFYYSYSHTWNQRVSHK